MEMEKKVTVAAEKKPAAAKGKRIALNLHVLAVCDGENDAGKEQLVKLSDGPETVIGHITGKRRNDAYEDLVGKPCLVRGTVKADETGSKVLSVSSMEEDAETEIVPSLAQIFGFSAPAKTATVEEGVKIVRDAVCGMRDGGLKKITEIITSRGLAKLLAAEHDGKTAAQIAVEEIDTADAERHGAEFSTAMAIYYAIGCAYTGFKNSFVDCGCTFIPGLTAAMLAREAAREANKDGEMISLKDLNYLQYFLCRKDDDGELPPMPDAET